MPLENPTRVRSTLSDNLMFFPLSVDDLDTIIAKGNTFCLDPGKSLRDGQAALYVIVSGKVSVKRFKPNEPDTSIQLGAGYSFGYLDEALGLGQSTDVIVLEPTELFRLEKQTFQHFLVELPHLAQHIGGLKSTMKALDHADTMSPLDQNTYDMSVRRGGRFAVDPEVSVC